MNEQVQEQTLQLAKETLFRGVIQGQMSPDDPQHQIIVTGCMTILAAATKGISVDDAIQRIVGESDSPKSDGGKNDGHPGQYL